MRIVLDAMGGDYAPQKAVQGSLEALSQISDLHLILVGDQKKIEAEIGDASVDRNRLSIVHASQVIEMGDDPIKAFKEKKDASMLKAFELVVAGKADAIASAGNSGAMMAAAHYIVKVIEQVKRPAIPSVVPRPNTLPGILIDVGVNTDIKADLLPVLAKLGSLYVQYVYKKDNPKVGLINIGEEENKGNKLCKEGYPLLKADKQINFVGNIEGRDIYDSAMSDVLVCDGFVGNIILKTVEGMYEILDLKLGIKHDYIKSFNYENYGGTPILGINGNVILGHGISNEVAFTNMVKEAYNVAKVDLATRIKESFENE